jgi:hypothetical protein
MKTTTRKKLYAFIAACMFAVMMGLSVNTSINGNGLSLSGINALASGTTGACTYSWCRDWYDQKCYANQNATNCMGVGGTEPCSSTQPC